MGDIKFNRGPFGSYYATADRFRIKVERAGSRWQLHITTVAAPTTPLYYGTFRALSEARDAAQEYVDIRAR